MDLGAVETIVALLEHNNRMVGLATGYYSTRKYPKLAARAVRYSVGMKTRGTVDMRYRHSIDQHSRGRSSRHGRNNRIRGLEKSFYRGLCTDGEREDEIRAQ